MKVNVILFDGFCVHHGITPMRRGWGDADGAGKRGRGGGDADVRRADGAVCPGRPVFGGETALSGGTTTMFGPTTSLSGQTLMFFGLQQRCWAKQLNCRAEQLSCQAERCCFSACNNVVR
ncbi:hypothetical protein [Zoogloea ramigera]|uniref:hypothetical protein n=1 Tax=Zoogloea ramigera TaxID=350 RepID=UPI001141CAD4|nr:hypothetical protein [Zoogloea ramigera]